GCNQRRGSTARVMRELPGLHVRLQRLEILINRDIELERRIGTAYLLLHEHGNLLGLSCSRTTTHPQSAPCASPFPGICVVGCSVIKVLPNKHSLQVTIHFFQENLMPLVTGSVIQHQKSTLAPSNFTNSVSAFDVLTLPLRGVIHRTLRNRSTR